MEYGATCSKCLEPNDRAPQRYCRACHAAHMREHRAPYAKMSAEDRYRSRCRGYTHRLIERGHLIPMPCNDCDRFPVQGHHLTYDNPRLVEWLCRACHLDRHARIRAGTYQINEEAPVYYAPPRNRRPGVVFTSAPRAVLLSIPLPPREDHGMVRMRRGDIIVPEASSAAVLAADARFAQIVAKRRGVA